MKMPFRAESSAKLFVLGRLVCTAHLDYRANKTVSADLYQLLSRAVLHAIPSEAPVRRNLSRRSNYAASL